MRKIIFCLMMLIGLLSSCSDIDRNYILNNVYRVTYHTDSNGRETKPIDIIFYSHYKNCYSIRFENDSTCYKLIVDDKKTNKSYCFSSTSPIIIDETNIKINNFASNKN